MTPKWLQRYRQHRPELALLLGGLGFRWAIAAGLPPGWDEAYYYLYTQHPSWSYFDHPAMVALTTGVGPRLTGQVSQLTIRLGTLVLHTGSLGLLWAMAEHLFGRRAARLTLEIATVTPLFTLAFGILTAPDTGLVFFGTLTLYLAALEFFGRDRYWPTYRIALIGLTLGLTCLSKYHGFVLGLGLVMFCLTGEHRRALRSPWLGVSLGLFGLTLFPLGWWGLQTDWISFRFHLGLRFDDEPLRYSLLQLAGSFALGLVYLFPAVGLPLWGVSLGEVWTRLGEGQDRRSAFLLWAGLPIAVGFTLLGGAQQIYPAWPAPGLWWLSPLLGVRATRWRWAWRWLVVSGSIMGGLLAIALLHVTLGIFQVGGDYALLGGFLPPQQDPVNQLIDTVQLSQQLEDSPKLRSALADADFILTNEYFLGGYFAMALHGLTAAPVTSFTQDPRGFALWFDPAAWIGQDAIYITTAAYHRTDITDHYQPYFATFEPLGSVTTERHGTVTNRFYLYRAKTLLVPYRYPY